MDSPGMTNRPLRHRLYIVLIRSVTPPKRGTSTHSPTPAMISRALRSTSLFLGLALAAVPALHGQSSASGRSNTGGFMIGGHLNGSALSFEGADTESGGGLGIAIGYGFTPKLMLYLNVDAAKVDIADTQIGGSYALGHGDLGIRYTFANSARAWVPYLNAAFTSRVASADVDNSLTSTTEVSISGPAVSVGGGVQYFFSERLALDAGLIFSGGKFSTIKVGSISVDVDDAESSNSTRFNIGLKFYPQVRR